MVLTFLRLPMWLSRTGAARTSLACAVPRVLRPMLSEDGRRALCARAVCAPARCVLPARTSGLCHDRNCAPSGCCPYGLPGGVFGCRPLPGPAGVRLAASRLPRCMRFRATCTRRVAEPTACCRDPLACRVLLVRVSAVSLLVPTPHVLLQVVGRMRLRAVCSAVGRRPGAGGVRRAASRLPGCMPFPATCTRRVREPTVCCRDPLARRVPLVRVSLVSIQVPIPTAVRRVAVRMRLPAVCSAAGR